MQKGNPGEFRALAGVDYSKVLDRQVGDKRFEREKPGAACSSSSSSVAKPGASSSTYDAFQRLAAGIDGRTLAEKIADPNRPTWEQYKQDNEDKLNMVGGDVKKMAEYRSQLDREREERLRLGRHFKSDSQSSVDDNDTDSSHDSLQKKSKKRKRDKKDKKSSKKSKKDKKSSSSKKHKKSKSDNHNHNHNNSSSGSEN